MNGLELGAEVLIRILKQQMNLRNRVALPLYMKS